MRWQTAAGWPSSTAATIPAQDADWIGSLTQAGGRIRALTTRPASFAVNSHLHRAIQLLKAAAAEDKAPPCVLYVFSDRTRPSWSEAVKPEELPPGSRAVFVDVGVEEPHDVAIERVEVDPPIVEPGKPMNVFITVRATGAPHGDLQLVWQLDNDPDQEKQPVRKKFTLAAGAEQRFSFPDQKAPLCRPTHAAGPTRSRPGWNRRMRWLATTADPRRFWCGIARHY